jgi:hypothetical protein
MLMLDWLVARLRPEVPIQEYIARLCVALECANDSAPGPLDERVRAYASALGARHVQDETDSCLETHSQTIRAYSLLVGQCLTRLEAVRPTSEFDTVHEMAVQYIRGRLRAAHLQSRLVNCMLAGDVACFQETWLTSRRHAKQNAAARDRLAAALWRVHLRHPDAFRLLVDLIDPPRATEGPPGLEAFSA